MPNSWRSKTYLPLIKKKKKKILIKTLAQKRISKTPKPKGENFQMLNYIRRHFNPEIGKAEKQL